MSPPGPVHPDEMCKHAFITSSGRTTRCPVAWTCRACKICAQHCRCGKRSGGRSPNPLLDSDTVLSRPPGHRASNSRLECGCYPADPKSTVENWVQCAECSAVPDPAYPPSEWSDDGSLGAVVELGYRDPRRDYGRTTDTVGLLVSDVGTICMRSGKSLLRTSPTSGGGLVSCVSGWRTGDMGFVAPQTRANDEIQWSMDSKLDGLHLTVLGVTKIVERTSDLCVQHWYTSRRIDWGDWAHCCRAIYCAFVKMVRDGKARLAQSEGGRGSIIFDCPFPCYEDSALKGAVICRFPAEERWQATHEACRGSYGPIHLIHSMYCPPEWGDVWEKCLVDREPSQFHSVFAWGASKSREKWWSISEVETGGACPVPVYAYTDELCDTEHSIAWIDPGAVEQASRSDRPFIVIGENHFSGFLSRAARSVLADVDCNDVIDCAVSESGLFWPPRHAIHRVIAMLPREEGRSTDLLQIAEQTGMSNAFAAVCLQNPYYELPIAQSSGCAFKLLRNRTGVGAGTIEPVPAGDVEGIVFTFDENGAAIGSFCRRPVLMDGGHIRVVDEGSSSKKTYDPNARLGAVDLEEVLSKMRVTFGLTEVPSIDCSFSKAPPVKASTPSTLCSRRKKIADHA